MSDLKWGFEKPYAHRHLPFKWHSSNGYTFHTASPLNKKSFRNGVLPVYRDDMIPRDTDYAERAQDERWAMSTYGCRRNLAWTDSLRMSRNPYPGIHGRETRYVQEPSPDWTASVSTYLPFHRRVPGFRQTANGARRRGVSMPNWGIRQVLGGPSVHYGRNRDPDDHAKAIRHDERVLEAHIAGLEQKLSSRPNVVDYKTGHV